MNDIISLCSRSRRFSSALLAALLIIGLTHGAWAQSPYFPNTRAAPYSPYGVGGYGTGGVMTRNPHVFRPMPPGLIKPPSAAPFLHPLPTMRGTPGVIQGPNLDAGSNFHPIGY
jgi:hypothetical protein